MSNKINKKKNIVSVFFTEFIRIKNVMEWSLISFGGFILGISSSDLLSYSIPLLVFLISTFCIMSFTFSINNYYDVESDRINPRRININAIASGRISKQAGIFLNIILIIIPLVVTFLFKFEVFLSCIVFIIWMWVYSAPPLRLKSRPGLDVIWHFFAFVIFVLWGSFIAGSVGLINWLVAISIGVFSCIGQVENHIYDYSFDKSSKTITFAVWLGLGKTKVALKIFAIAHFILLVPLVLFYISSYLITIISVCLITAIGLIILKVKKDALRPHVFIITYLAFILGGAVYFSVFVYHICTLFGIQPLELLVFSII